jgi:hypothetical protein
LLVGALDGERQSLSTTQAEKLLRAGRYRWPTIPAVAANSAHVEKFIQERAKK